MTPAEALASLVPGLQNRGEAGGPARAVLPPGTVDLVVSRTIDSGLLVKVSARGWGPLWTGSVEAARGWLHDQSVAWMDAIAPLPLVSAPSRAKEG